MRQFRVERHILCGKPSESKHVAMNYCMPNVSKVVTSVMSDIQYRKHFFFNYTDTWTARPCGPSPNCCHKAESTQLWAFTSTPLNIFNPLKGKKCYSVYCYHCVQVWFGLICGTLGNLYLTPQLSWVGTPSLVGNFPVGGWEFQVQNSQQK